MSTNVYIALTTCPDAQIASTLAHACVESQLAACVNIIPAIQSVYQWQGKIEHDTESLLVIKTTQQKLAALEELILAQHPYDVPEFVVLNIEHGASDYLSWIIQSLNRH